MKKFIIIFLFYCCHNAISQWSLSTILPNASYAFFSEDNLLIAGTDHGIFFTTDYGDNWIQRRNPLSNDSVTAIGTDGKRVIVAYWRNGIYEYNMELDTFIKKSNELLDTVLIFKIALSGNNIFLGTYNCGVFRSTDLGTTWLQINVGLNYKIVETIYIKGDTVFAGSGNGFYVSTNKGDNWIEKSEGLKKKEIYTITTIGNSIFVGTNGGGVFCSSDEGNTWHETNTGLPKGLSVNSMISIENNLFIAATTTIMIVGGFYFSTNSGDSWMTIRNGLNTFLNKGIGIANIKDFIFILMDDSWEKAVGKVFRAKIPDLLSATSVAEQIEVKNEGHFYAAKPVPIPASEFTKIKIYWDSDFDIVNAYKELYNNIGSKMKQESNLFIENIQQNNAELIWDCSKVPSGVYFIVINYYGTSRFIPVLVGR
jgi:photosystem II stability/assembly factor-like uncharacterized protein